MYIDIMGIDTQCVLHIDKLTLVKSWNLNHIQRDNTKKCKNKYVKERLNPRFEHHLYFDLKANTTCIMFINVNSRLFTVNPNLIIQVTLKFNNKIRLKRCLIKVWANFLANLFLVKLHLWTNRNLKKEQEATGCCCWQTMFLKSISWRARARVTWERQTMMTCWLC